MEKTRLTIMIASTARMDVPLVFRQSISHGVWVDWGDGSYPETFAEIGVVYTSHNYSVTGTYEITLHTVDDCVLELGGANLDAAVIGGAVDGYRNMLVEAVIGDDVNGISKYAFRGCEGLESVILPDGLLFIDEKAFDGCVSLESIELPSKITIISNNVFFGCSALRSVTMPPNINEIGDMAFYGCSQLKEIDLSHVRKIGVSAFSNCRKLKQIVFGQAARYIGDYAFESCTSMQSVSFGDVQTIGVRSFGNCRTLGSIDLPSTLRIIDEGAFAGCRFVYEINCASNIAPIMRYANTFEDITDFVITVPKNAGDTYKQSTNWCIYSNKIVEAEK